MIYRVIHTTSRNKPIILWFNYIPENISEEEIINKFKEIYTFDNNGTWNVAKENELPCNNFSGVVNWRKV